MAALLLRVSMSMNVNTAAKLVNATAAGVVIHLQLCLTNILQNYKYLTAAGCYNINSFPWPHIFVPTAARPQVGHPCYRIIKDLFVY